MKPQYADQFASVESAMRYVESLITIGSEEAVESELENVSAGFGHYRGLPVKVVFSEERTGNLIEAITYFQENGQDWPVPAGAWLDGASIPRVFWTLIGGPYEGKYLTASIVHDHYCITKDRPWKDVHHMFHDAMRCSGVSKTQAAVMFYAVYRFGPRWPDPTLESVVVPTPAELFDASAARSFALDIEAIVQHELSSEEIAVLADARGNEWQEDTALEGLFGGPKPKVSDSLVIPGGQGTTEDVAVVTARTRALPPYVVQHFFEKKIRIVACRSSVTDFEKSLRGVVPRGWEAVGKTWDSVPGSYFDGSKRVVIATTTDASGRRIVPEKSTGLHGSDDLVVHESLHGYDYSMKHQILSDPTYTDARDRDQGGLTDYENQAGQAGLEETFAETGAQFCVDVAALQSRCPTLAQFWEAMPLSNEAPFAVAQEDTTNAPIGTATRQPNGSLQFDLRATDGSGAIGHASLTVAPSEPQHAKLEARLFPPSSLEGVNQTTVLFFR